MINYQFHKTHARYKTVAAIIVFLILLVLSLAGCLAKQPQVIPQRNGKFYYVSKKGSNSDGKSWRTAWNELNKINWSVIQPGDTILLDGGRQSMTYTTTLTIGKSGTQGTPITIERASDAGHTGHVILFGGRAVPLPYCGQANYIYQPAPTAHGIVYGSHSWVVIDGISWDGISIYGYNSDGIDMTDGPSNDTLQNLEIYDNGNASQRNGAWYPNSGIHGVYLTGSNLTFEQMDIHDNADDEFDTGVSHTLGVNNITINLSWLHVTREDPRTAGLPFNEECVHQDGYQIYDGGVQNNVTVENSVVGPGLGDALILGQSPTSIGDSATVNNVTIKNDLFINKDVQIMGYPQVKETGWVIDHVTVITPGSNPGGDYPSLSLQGFKHTVTNSIFYGGRIYLPDGLMNASGNCAWKTVGNNSALAGQIVDPEFMTDVSSYNYSTSLMTMQKANYALHPTSPCKGAGSSITSIGQFLNMVYILNLL